MENIIELINKSNFSICRNRLYSGKYVFDGLYVYFDNMNDPNDLSTYLYDILYIKGQSNKKKYVLSVINNTFGIILTIYDIIKIYDNLDSTNKILKSNILWYLLDSFAIIDRYFRNTYHSIKNFKQSLLLFYENGGENAEFIQSESQAQFSSSQPSNVYDTFKIAISENAHGNILETYNLMIIDKENAELDKENAELDKEYIDILYRCIQFAKDLTLTF
jgi:hypothetical protein